MRRSVGFALLMKIPTRVFLGSLVDQRRPKTLGDEMDHAVLNLKLAADAEEVCGLDEKRVFLKDPTPDHDVDETCFVLEGHEDHAGGRARPLATDDKARVACTCAVAHGVDAFGIR